MKRRGRIFSSWHAPSRPALAVLVAVAASLVYLHPWEATRQLPACDEPHIRREVQSKMWVAAPEIDVLSNANAVEFDSFRETKVVQVKGVIHERACATTMRLDRHCIEIPFQILKTNSAAGYRLSVLYA